MLNWLSVSMTICLLCTSIVPQTTTAFSLRGGGATSTSTSTNTNATLTPKPKPKPDPPPPWSTATNYVMYQGSPYRIKGVNMHGLETGCRSIDGMWKNPLSYYLDKLVTWDVNAVRLPISYEVMNGLDVLRVNDGCVTADPKYKGSLMGDFIQDVLDECFKRGISVLVDRHNIQDRINPYPFTGEVSESDVVNAWGLFLKRFSKHPAIFAIETQNEPHGECDLMCAFQHAEKVVKVGETSGYRGLYLLPGVQYSPNHSDQGAWGGLVNDIVDDGIPTFAGLHSRIGLSVHVYSFDVRGSVALDDGNAEHFESQFGFVHKLNGTIWDGTPVLITEYGGHMVPGTKDMIVYENLASYLEVNKMDTGTFMWVLGQSSSDTGGIITGDDWKGEDHNKLAYMKRLQPNPSPLVQQQVNGSST
jgi:aryl-phospho-beta-D-glucosidase BglC (GH1 family)